MWQTSVQQEAKELSCRITKLSTFLKSDSSNSLSLEMLSLLDLQLSTMRSYHTLLLERLKLSEKEEECEDCYTDAESIFC